MRSVWFVVVVVAVVVVVLLTVIVSERSFICEANRVMMIFAFLFAHTYVLSRCLTPLTSTQIKGMLRFDPCLRLTAQQALAHKYFKLGSFSKKKFD
jgi:cbb3-type cytochrome oxidase subunit 1